MKKLDEETALSVLFSNTKRKKRNDDLVTIAMSCKYLVDKYGSQQALAKKIGLSAEMIRQFLATLELPEEVQKLVSERKIDSVDIVKEIAAIKDPQKQISVANTIINYLSKDARDIKRLIKVFNLSVEDAKRTVMEAKPKRLHFFIMDFDDKTYKLILKHSKKMKIQPSELVSEIVMEWLKQKA